MLFCRQYGMEIQSTLLSRLQPAQTTPVDLKNWLVGKLLNASVVERRLDNTLLLKVQDQFIEESSQQPHGSQHPCRSSSRSLIMNVALWSNETDIDALIATNLQKLNE